MDPFGPTFKVSFEVPTRTLNVGVITILVWIAPDSEGRATIR
jgi:hypothetical protein